ncbi:uncharacterized protein BP5553_00526 [Venustampulla echinocandica]|uniref:Xylanolytic transcriptional activator regulatory domain-containing protein n=1 Tax=Venustampulla echinocandica TaxID=2656787 RepID=A0A370TYD4_9HELO|nr:uncharacterized protein BP5553_00526 [Venustampulla echinocandica]RDL40547.1 hypothetical protein BP5553_00526 [Venustampulla echinocandica]
MPSTAMETIDESSISSNARMLACTSCKQYVSDLPFMIDLSCKPRADYEGFATADARKDAVPQSHSVTCVCRRLGVRCVYPRFSFKPGPKKKQAFTAIPRTEELPRTEQPTIADSSIRPGEEYNFLSLPRDGYLAYDSSMPGQRTTDASGSQHNPETSDVLTEPHLFNPPPIFDETLFHDRLSSISSDAITSDPGGPLALLGQNTDPFRVVPPIIYPPSPSLPSREIINHLVDVFFDVVHPQFRLLHRPTLTEQLHDPSYLATKEAAFLLNAIFALTARYLGDIRVELFDLSLLRRQSDKSSLSNTSLLNPSYQRKGRWERGQGLLQLANRLLQEEIAEAERLENKTGETQEPRIQLLQAAALLAFAELGMGISSRAHSMMSMCARMAYDLDLGSIDCDDYESQVELSLDKHSWIRKEELRRLW